MEDVRLYIGEAMPAYVCLPVQPGKLLETVRFFCNVLKWIEDKTYLGSSSTARVVRPPWMANIRIYLEELAEPSTPSIIPNLCLGVNVKDARKLAQAIQRQAYSEGLKVEIVSEDTHGTRWSVALPDLFAFRLVLKTV